MIGLLLPFVILVLPKPVVDDKENNPMIMVASTIMIIVIVAVIDSIHIHEIAKSLCMLCVSTENKIDNKHKTTARFVRCFLKRGFTIINVRRKDGTVVRRAFLSQGTYFSINLFFYFSF